MRFDNKAGDSLKTMLPPLSVLGVAMLWLMYQSGMLALWVESEEYGHGAMVVGLLAYIFYRRRKSLMRDPVKYSWVGLPVALLATVLLVAGGASGIGVLSMYGIWLFAIAVVFVIGGLALFMKFLIPLLIVLLLIPLPQPFGPMLTAQLQLVSSKLGVWFIRLFGGVVYLEGNVLDMGGTKLLVAEACAGLRYLFPLMSIGAILGYMLRVPVWMRWTVFLVTVPITIFMNSLRIGLTGILTEKWGTMHTEGILHFFEGWVVFLVATLLLLVIVTFLLKLHPQAGSLTNAISLDGVDSTALQNQPGTPVGLVHARLAWPLAVIVAFTAIGFTYLSTRQEVLPQRQVLTSFPEQLGEWRAHEYRLPVATETVAGASEYFFGDFSEGVDKSVNLYIAFYESQRHGEVPHSPKVCIPGDGWVIESSQPVTLKNQFGEQFDANRLVMAKGEQRMLAYYWLKQGKKMYYLNLAARMDLVRFFLMENRTDGALVRMVTNVDPAQGIQAADDRLVQFSRLLMGVLPNYVPD